MKAVYINSFGSQLDIALRDVPKPKTPTGTQVSVRVSAAGLNRADLLQAAGRYPPPEGYSPNIPGLEFAGEVAEIGDAVINWKIGDRVFGITSGEAQAEYVNTDSSLLARIPDNLSFEESAAIPEAFITAHDDALVTQCRIAGGEHLLIHAVGSGVGLAALQIAKAKGCFVVGTSRTLDKIDRCREYGIDEGLLIADPNKFSADAIELSGRNGFDVVLDLVGAAYFQQNLSCLAPKGRILLVGLTSGAKTSIDLATILQKRAHIMGTVLRGRSSIEKASATSEFVRDVLPLLTSGHIRPNLDRVFSAADSYDAYKYLASNTSFGKVVLKF